MQIENMPRSLEKYLPIVGILLSEVIFFLIYDSKILNPTFIGWTMEGDPAQHFLGWHFFRSEPWSFPLGIIHSYQYPQGTSLVYTDSIPLLAILLKLLSPILPDVFQFHGIWLLLCYTLQGYFSVLLLKQVSKNSALILLGTLFFLLSPVMVDRAESHETLSAHWLILASLYLYFQTNNTRNKIRWIVLLVATAAIHFYLLAMSFMIFLGYLLKQIMSDRKEKIFPAMKLLTTALGSIIVTMWIVGYFVINAKSTNDFGFGDFSMNLLAPLNPAPKENLTFFPPVSLASEFQYEGFNYLGLGVLMMIATAIYKVIQNRRVSLAIKSRLSLILPLVLVSLILLALSLSNRVTFANIEVFKILLPESLERILGVLRASGRMFWAVSYILILGAIAVITRYNRPKKAAILIFVFVCFQVIDFFPWYSNVDLGAPTWDSPLKSDLWNKLMEKTEHVVFIPAGNTKDLDYVPFGFLAAKHGNTINIGYTARLNYVERKRYAGELLKDFRTGKIRSDSLYVIKNNNFYQPNSSEDFMWGTLDGYNIIAPKIDAVALKPWPSISIVFSGEQSYTLKQLVDRFSVPGYAIFLAVRDEGDVKIPEDFVSQMKAMGSVLDQLEFRGSYAAIILNGNLATEKLDNHAKVEIEYAIPQHSIRLMSAGNPFGDDSVIDIDGISLSLNRRGFNVVVLSLDDSKVRRYSYDTHENNDAVLANE